MISIVTGTLDIKILLPNLTKNIVDSNDKLELILFNDDTLYIKKKTKK